MIYGISGKAGSGKDTFFNILKDKLYPNEVTNGKFSYVLKRMAADMLDVDIAQFEDQDFKASVIPTSDSGMTYRDFLLMLGTELMRGADPNYWVKKAIELYYPLAPVETQRLVFFTDCRFHNEAKAIQDRGGKIIRIERDVPGVEHVSDTALDDYSFDYVISNNGTLEELEDNVLNFIRMEGLHIS